MDQHLKLKRIYIHAKQKKVISYNIKTPLHNERGVSFSPKFSHMKPLQATRSEAAQPRDHTLPTHTLQAHMEAKCTHTHTQAVASDCHTEPSFQGLIKRGVS